MAKEKTFWGNPFYDDLILFLENVPSSQDKLKPINLANRIFELIEKNNVTEFKKEIKKRLLNKKKDSWPYTGYLFMAVRISGFKKDIFNKDLDNLLKTLFDTLKGIVFENDNQIIKLSAEKIISKKNEEIGVSIGIKKLTNPNIIELYPQLLNWKEDTWQLERQKKIKNQEYLNFDFY